MSTPSDPRDADLHARLRAADPAADLPAAEPSEVDHLLTRVVHSDLRETGTRRRNALTWLVAAAAVVVIAVGVTWWIRDDDAEPGVVAKPLSSGSAQPAAEVTELTAGSAAARCMMPTAELLAAKPVAFEGTVLGIADGVVTIRTATVYAGDVGDRVTVRGTIAPDTGTIEGDPEFVAGQDYLVAADAGQVVGCGLSGPVTPELTRLYAEAFPR